MVIIVDRRVIQRCQEIQIVLNVLPDSPQMKFKLSRSPVLSRSIYTLHLATVNSNKFTWKQVDPFTQAGKLTGHFNKCFGILAAEIADGLEVRPQSLKKPDHFQVNMACPLQFPPGTDSVEIPVNIKFKKNFGMICRTATALGILLRKYKAAFFKIHAFSKLIQKPHRAVIRNIVVKTGRQKHHLIPRSRLNVLHK